MKVKAVRGTRCFERTCTLRVGSDERSEQPIINATLENVKEIRQVVHQKHQVTINEVTVIVMYHLDQFRQSFHLF